MLKYSPVFFIFLLQTLTGLLAQTDWRAVVNGAFESLEQEVIDSIASCQQDASQIRVEMDDLLDQLGLTRSHILGNEDEYFKEGMHKHFKQAPTPLQVSLDRDPKMVRFENLHRQLYFRDKVLFYWKGVQAKWNKHPFRENYAHWSGKFEKLDASQQKKMKPAKAKEQWVKDELICEMSRNLKTSNPFVDSKVGSFEVKFLDSLKTYNRSRAIVKKGLPCLPEDIICSFPTNGQFAFHPSESIPKVGYVAFQSEATDPIINLLSQEQLIKARWTSAAGHTQYTTGEYRYFEGTLYFNIPNSLESDQIYRLQLIALPKEFKLEPMTPEICWDIYLGKNTSRRQNLNASINGETIITELYFRAGKYEPKPKLETMRGTVDWEQAQVVFETDEPLDHFEMYGSGKLPPTVAFVIQTVHFYSIADAINSDEVLYYLTVPKVEPTENVPLSQLLVAEMDNTLDAVFIRNTAQGNPKGYRKVPDPVTIEAQLPGGYSAPAYKAVRIQDSLLTDAPVPFISKEHFEAGRPLHFAPTRCTLKVGELKLLLTAAHSLQRQLQHRVEERIDFFYSLEKRRAERNGENLTVSKEQIREQEMKYLPKQVKKLLEADIPSCFQENFTLLYARYFPGTERLTTSYSLKF